MTKSTFIYFKLIFLLVFSILFLQDSYGKDYEISLGNNYVLADNAEKKINTNTTYSIALSDNEEVKSILDESNNLYALAENSSPRPSTSNNRKDWQMFVTLYLWLAGLNGEVGIGETQADVDSSFGDIWENFDVGGQAHIELWWKKWIFYIDPTYIKPKAETPYIRSGNKQEVLCDIEY